jgi:hypothetical protein
MMGYQYMGQGQIVGFKKTHTRPSFTGIDNGGAFAVMHGPSVVIGKQGNGDYLSIHHLCNGKKDYVRVQNFEPFRLRNIVVLIADPPYFIRLSIGTNSLFLGPT